MKQSQKPDLLDIKLFAAMPQAYSKDIDIYDAADESLLEEKQAKKINRRIIKRIKYIDNHSAYSPFWESCKCAVAAILVVMSISFAGVMSIEAVRVAVWEAVTTWYEKSIFFQFVTEDAAIVPDEILEYKEPVVGEDFIRTDGMKLPFTYVVEYNNGQYNISYKQSLLDEYEVLLSNHDSEMETIRIHSTEYSIFNYNVGDYTYYTIVWNDGMYAYSINSNVEIDKLIEIIKTIK